MTGWASAPSTLRERWSLSSPRRPTEAERASASQSPPRSSRAIGASSRSPPTVDAERGLASRSRWERKETIMHEIPRILVVDDRPEMAEMIADDLSERGYDGVATTSGHEAVRMLQTERVDVLVTDVRMPEVDGMALLSLSLQLDPSRPVIMMTAYGTL